VSRPLPVLERRAFGQTYRLDRWWEPNVAPLVVFTAFVVYATWRMFQNAHYWSGPYLSPLYSPELFGDSPHAWFGPKPSAWPGWIPFSPALLVLPFPALFRFTCYYYRGVYYRAFWADPPGCAVGEPRQHYLGERFFPLVLQNVHRYFLYAALIFLVILGYDAWRGFWFTDSATGATRFGVGLGSLVLLINWVLLLGYTLGCHALRHVIGGVLDEVSRARVRWLSYIGCSWLNRAHMQWAWTSLVWVAFTDIYIRLVAAGVWTDVRLV
jgi:hypothetical protein